MTAPKQPQDHKKAGGELHTFEHNGKEYTFEKPFDTVETPKWLRANRRRDQIDLVFTLLEEIAGEECLEVIDEMTNEEFEKFSDDIGKARAAQQG